MHPLAAVVVVYNMACRDSVTCQALLQLDDPAVSVVICDNSTKDYGNRDFCSTHGWSYLGGAGNVGLSKAYNAGIDYVKASIPAEAVCLFDDDTHISPDYFLALRQAMAAGKENIFVPLIYSGGALMSPNLLKPGYRIARFQTEKEALSYTGQDISAINSCMALRLCLFDDYRYDENIFLDGIDHKFIGDMKARGESVKVFPYRCEQTFSGDEKPALQSAMARFLIFRKDFSYILRSSPLTYLYLVGKRALKLTLQYKTPKFLFAFLKHS